jgi:hypothetical protein
MADDIVTNIHQRKNPTTSFLLDTNYGGKPVTVCACGVLLMVGPSAWQHIDECSAFLTVAKEEDNRG